MPKAATARKSQQTARSQEPQTPPDTTPEPAPPASEGEGHAEPGPEPEPIRLAPAIGDVVYFIDRPRFVHLVESRKPVDPLPAMVCLIHRSATGEFEGNVGLVVFDPDSGAFARHRVPFSHDMEPEHWWPRPLTPTAFTMPAIDLVNALKPLVEAAVAEQLTALSGQEAADTVDV